MKPNLAARLAVALVLATPLSARATRPTPHQMIDAALRPVTDQLESLHPTDAERHDVADVMLRAESTAAELVDAQNRNATADAQALSQRIEIFARLVRGRIEAARAEAEADRGEHAAMEADARRVQARAALERATEHRLEVDHASSASAAPEPAPASAAPSSASPAPAATVTEHAHGRGHR